MKPLPGRRNTSTQLDFSADGAEATGSIEDALHLLTGKKRRWLLAVRPLKPLASAQRFHLTEVHAEIEGNIRFPAFDRASWREVTRETHPAADGNPAYVLSCWNGLRPAAQERSVIVVRSRCRRYFVDSNGVARCRIQRLSQTMASPFCHACE